MTHRPTETGWLGGFVRDRLHPAGLFRGASHDRGVLGLALAGAATIVDSVRTANPNAVVLVDGGDLWRHVCLF